MHWYEGCKFVLSKQFNRVFTHDDNSNEENYGWAEVFLKIAKDGVFGDLTNVNGTEMTTLLLHLQVHAKDFEKMKASREKQSS